MLSFCYNLVMGNKYHFTLFYAFKKDINIDLFEKAMGVKAYRKNSLKDSKGQNKSAKYWIKTQDFTNPDSAMELEKFIKQIGPKLALSQPYLEQYDGFVRITMYFDEIKDKPYIALSPESIKILAQNNVKFDVDFKF